MLSNKILNKELLLLVARDIVYAFCTQRGLQIIPIIYGVVPSRPEQAKAVFEKYPPLIKVWDHYYDFLSTKKDDKERVTHIHKKILHELIHYQDFVHLQEIGRTDYPLEEHGKDGAYERDEKLAIDVVRNMSEQVINPKINSNRYPISNFPSDKELKNMAFTKEEKRWMKSVRRLEVHKNKNPFLGVPTLPSGNKFKQFVKTYIPTEEEWERHKMITPMGENERKDIFERTGRVV